MAENKTKKKVGNPAFVLTDDMADAICEHVANGGTTLAFSKMEGNPSRWTIYRCLAKGDQDLNDRKDTVYSRFSYNYARAIDAGVEYSVDEIQQLADEIPEGCWFEDVEGNKYTISQVKETNKELLKEGQPPLTVELKGLSSELLKKRDMQIDVRKWAAGKKKPKKYGNKVDMTLGGDASRPLTTVDHKELVKSLGKEEARSLLEKLRGFTTNE